MYAILKYLSYKHVYENILTPLLLIEFILTFVLNEYLDKYCACR